MHFTIPSKYCHDFISLASQMIHANTGLQADQSLLGKELVSKINSVCVGMDLNQN